MEEDMTTTDRFQKLPTFYRSSEECNKYERPQTNPRYPNFNQFCFTAGDVEQFETYRDPSNGMNRLPDIDANNVWNAYNTEDKKFIGENLDWPKYRNLAAEAVDTTFRYIFDKFKKGLFIKIKDNRLDVFLPFSKHNYVNEWSSYIKHPPSHKTMEDFLVYASKLQGFDISSKRIPPVTHWYANNCLVRWDGGENDRGMSNLKDMFLTLCQTRSVPDIELFINKRDFPILGKKDVEPYEHLFGFENMPLLSHSYESYCPILSNVTTNLHSDIPMPTPEDWARVSSQEDGKFFAPDCKNYRHDFSIPWEQRKPTAVFRGASTGCGSTVETNPRLRISSIPPTVEDGFPLLDAGIMKWNLRPRKHMSSPYLQVIDTAPFKTVAPLTPTEQASYKYIVNVDGHVSAFRLSLELSMGCVVLMVESKYRMWFRKYLVEYEHYVPVKEDLSDLLDQIRWCRQNDEKCKQIAENAKAFYNQYLTKNGVLDYMQLLLNNIKQVTGTYFYNSITPSEVLQAYQRERIQKIQGNPVEDCKHTNDSIMFHFENRNYYAMEGLQMVLREMGGIKEKDTKTVHKSHDTHNYTSSFIHSIPNRKLLFKQTSRQAEWVNEAFCGISEINTLVRDIPNFRYTYYADMKKGLLISEYVEGLTFKEFIQNGCTMSSFVAMIVMINMALAVAQEQIGFVHYDLVPWNIIIMTYSHPQEITYHFHNYVFTVRTRYIPVIIDYGRAHVISVHSEQVMHHGTIEPFKMSKMQDCFTLLISSVYEMASAIQKRSRFIAPAESSVLLKLVNFLSETKFMRRPLQNVAEMTSFLEIHKKYNELIYGDKCDLEQYKTPTELIEYIMIHDLMDDKTITCEQVIWPQKAPVPIYHQPQFYYDLITRFSPKNTIIGYLHRVTTDGLASLLDIVKKNEMLRAYAASNIVLCIRGVQSFVNEFMQRDADLLAMTEDLLLTVEHIYTTKYDPVPFHVSYYPTSDRLLLAKYTPKTFSNPSCILSLLQAFLTTTKKMTLLTFREMFVFSSFYNVPYPLPLPFFHAHKRILDLERLPLLNYNASIKSLAFMSRIIYTKDREELKKMYHIPQKTFQTVRDILNLL